MMHINYEDEPIQTPEPEEEDETYSIPSFPVSSTVSQGNTVYEVRQVYDVDTKEWFDAITDNVTDFQNNISIDIVGIQNNLTVINNSIASLSVDIGDNSQQIELMQNQLAELKTVNSVLFMFYTLFLIEWMYKHIKSWRLNSTKNARRGV